MYSTIFSCTTWQLQKTLPGKSLGITIGHCTKWDGIIVIIFGNTTENSLAKSMLVRLLDKNPFATCNG